MKIESFWFFLRTTELVYCNKVQPKSFHFCQDFWWEKFFLIFSWETWLSETPKCARNYDSTWWQNSTFSQPRARFHHLNSHCQIEKCWGVFHYPKVPAASFPQNPVTAKKIGYSNSFEKFYVLNTFLFATNGLIKISTNSVKQLEFSTSKTMSHLFSRQNLDSTRIPKSFHHRLISIIKLVNTPITDFLSGFNISIGKIQIVAKCSVTDQSGFWFMHRNTSILSSLDGAVRIDLISIILRNGRTDIFYQILIWRDSSCKILEKKSFCKTLHRKPDSPKLQIVELKIISLFKVNYFSKTGLIFFSWCLHVNFYICRGKFCFKKNSHSVSFLRRLIQRRR